MVANPEIVRRTGFNAMALAQYAPDFPNGQRNILRRSSRHPYVIQIGKAHQLRSVRCLVGRKWRIQRQLLARINLVAPGDRSDCRSSLLTLPLTPDAILHRGQRREQEIVLVPVHHVDAFAAEHTEHFHSDVFNADFLADW